MWSRRPSVLWRSTSLGPVVLGPDDERPSRLGGVGAVVWEALDEPLDVGGLVALARTTGVEVGAAAVEEALAGLVGLGLVEQR